MPKTILQITDQVNIKFKDLDPFVRRKVSEALKFMVPYARHMPSFKLGRWDGKVSFATVGGATFLNLLDRILPIIIDAGYEIEIDDKRPIYNFDFPAVSEDMFAHKVWPEGHPVAGDPIMLRDYQVEVIDTFIKNPQSIQNVSTGAGKAQPLWSKIKIPGGWTTMGEILPGDLVSTPDGGTAKVIKIYPQGEKDFYRITFNDGRTAEACGDHLWDVYNVDRKQKMVNGQMTRSGDPWRTLTTFQIIDQMKNSKRPLRLPLVKSENRPDIDLMIHPYVLGCLIGDGGLSCSNIVLSSRDQHIIDRCNELVVSEYAFQHKDRYDFILRKTPAFRDFCSLQPRGNKEKNNRYREELVLLGLFGTKSNTKFIPEKYINQTSHSQRIELLRGLIDTDGYVGKHGDIVYTTVSETLAQNVSELVRSIGGLATTKTKRPFYRNKTGERTDGQLAYNVSIRYPSPAELVTLPRKKERFAKDYLHRDSLKLRITSIEKIGKTECQCILIDHPDHLYITDNYVVTHNTITSAALSAIVEPYGRSIIIVPNRSLVEQTEEDYRNLGLDVGVIYGGRHEYGHTHTIATWQSLAITDKKSKKNESEIDFSELVKDVVCVMVDEVHTAKGNELKDLLCGPLAAIPIRWGFTGTVPKEDHEFMCLLAGLGPVVGEVRAKTLQDKGVLAECDIEIIQLIEDHVEFKDYHEEHDFLMTDPDRLEWIANYTQELSATGNVLVLIDRIETGKVLNSLIAGSTFISGVTKTKDRRTEYKSVSEGGDKVLIATSGVAAVGISITHIDHVIFLSYGKSHTKSIQSIGRGLRKGGGKTKVKIHDICSSLKFDKRHLAKRKGYYSEAEYPFTMRKVSYR